MLWLLQDSPISSDIGPLGQNPLENSYVLAVLTVVGSFFAAKLVNFLVTRTIKVTAKRTQTDVDDRLLDSLHGPIVKSVVLVGFWFACDLLKTEDQPLLWADDVILSLAILIWLAAAIRTSGLLLRAMSHQDSRFQIVEERTLPLFDNLGKLGLVVLAGYLTIEVWDAEAGAWLASAGVAGIAIGFAAKDTLANLFAGVFIIADAPYQIGDCIVLDSGYRGRVQHIGLRSTRILTRDDVEITIPNSIIGNGSIVNESSGTPQYRLRIKVGVAYGSDLDRVRKALLAVSKTTPGPLKSPEPRVRFRRFGDSTLDFELLIWIRDPELRGKTLDALNTAVYERFREDGIEIAFPQQDLHIRTMAATDSQG